VKLKELLVADAKSQPRPRSTAWDHIDAIPEENAGSDPPVVVEQPPEVPATDYARQAEVAWNGAVDTVVAANPTLGAPAPARTARTDAVVRRVSLIFYHLMRSHLGVDQVNQIADWASRGVTGSGLFPDLQARAEELARLVVEQE
jgi:hypothetical protein